MSAESDKVRDTFAEQLARFDDKLFATTNNVEMLADIQEGIGNLLASTGGSEGEIRRILQDRYDEGALRKETFQLVKSMLDRYVTEKLPTSSTTAAVRKPPAPIPTGKPNTVDFPEGDDAFCATSGIPSDFCPTNTAESG